MAHQKNSNVALCPECDGVVQLSGKLHIGQRLSCRRCGSALVITDRKPLELDLADGSVLVNGHVKAQKKKMREPSMENSPGSPMIRVTSADCPECSTKLRFHKPLRAGQLIVCHECDETLEVVSLRPLELSWADDSPWNVEEISNNRNFSRYRIN